jgi:hypothetical protein
MTDAAPQNKILSKTGPFKANRAQGVLDQPRAAAEPLGDWKCPGTFRGEGVASLSTVQPCLPLKIAYSR